MYSGAPEATVTLSQTSKSIYYGKHELWRQQILQQDATSPARGRFREAYPDYDEDG